MMTSFPGTTDTSSTPQSSERRWKLRFWTIFVGQALSQAGSALTQFVLLWWITDTTGSVSSLATAGLAALLPQALLSPLGGTLADRYNRRVLMIASDLISALCMVALIALFLSDRIELWHAYAMMLIRSAMAAFQAPASFASMAMLVPATFLVRAAGLNQSLQSLTMVAAAPLGALAISIMPMGWALAIDVITAGLAILPLLFFRVPQSTPPGGRRERIWKEFLDGLQVVWDSPALRQLYLLLAVVVLTIMPAFTLVPLLVKQHFGGGAVHVAALEGLSGVGMILGGLIVAAIAPVRLTQWVLWGFAASCASLALTALVPSDLFAIAVVWWVISGIAFVVGNVPLTALLQASVPNHLHGRVLSLLTTVMALAAPIGLALVTPLGEWIGVRGVFVVAGIAGTAASLVGLFLPALRSMDGPHVR